jgi:hypothetical protein
MQHEIRSSKHPQSDPPTTGSSAGRGSLIIIASHKRLARREHSFHAEPIQARAAGATQPSPREERRRCHISTTRSGHADLPV